MTPQPAPERVLPPIGATISGFPRIGPRRELKRALEDFWSGRSDRPELDQTARTERARTWRALAEAGLSTVPSNTFSLYDQMLDTALLLGAVPERHRALYEADPLAGLFAMARGRQDAAPLEMTKWFDSNYHYLVPEIGPTTPLTLHPDKPLAEVAEARELGLETRPVLVGPVTFLLLAKPAAGSPDGFTPLRRLDDVLPLYADLLSRLARAGVAWAQLDEPALVRDLAPHELEAVQDAYTQLTGVASRPGLFVDAPYGPLREALPRLLATGVEAVGVDLVRGDPAETVLALAAETANGWGNRTLVAGIVDGRNVWRNHLSHSLAQLEVLRGRVGEPAVSTSCSLLHVPYTVAAESADDVPDAVRRRLAFAHEKVAEVVTLYRGLTAGREAVRTALARSDALQAELSAGRRRATGSDGEPADPVRAEASSIGAARGDAEQRRRAQRAVLDLPPLPTTTIGSFPQTAEVRSARADLRAGRIDEAEYTRVMRGYIERAVRLQEKLGLDVLVHGEPERNDMVQYFAELLDGFVTTRFGWVQSYGSRCVRPPILYGDVRRPAPMTVEWARYAQSLTDRPVKGMLTGPVTILAWSFVRDDQPLAATARQVALAIRAEVRDLEAAGVRIVQVDEPALRELLPLRAQSRARYLEWAVAAFRLATSGVDDATQIHTHLCYSEFGEVVEAIDALDADVTSIEAARSAMEVLPSLTSAGWSRDVGPGVYDIHSPRVPSVAEIESLLRTAIDHVPADRLWVNPDCGLKTRGEAEAAAALANLVAAAEKVRASL